MSRSRVYATLALLVIWFPADLAAMLQPDQEAVETDRKGTEKQKLVKVSSVTWAKEQPAPLPLQPPFPGSIRSRYLVTIRVAVAQLDYAVDRALHGNAIEFEVANRDAQQIVASAIAGALGEGEAQVAEALRSYSGALQSCRVTTAGGGRSALPAARGVICTQDAATRRQILELTLAQDFAAPTSADSTPILSRQGDPAVIATAEKVLFALQSADSSFDAIRGDQLATLAILDARAALNEFAVSPEALKIPQTTAAFRSCIDAFDGALRSSQNRPSALASARRQLAIASSLLFSYRLVAAESASLDPLDPPKTAQR